MGIFGTSSPFDQYVERATSEKNTNEDWGQIMDICDRVKESNTGPKDCLKSIVKRLNSENPRIVLQTITLLDACINNCGRKFLLEVASREFEQELRKILTSTRTHHKVSERLRESLKKWADGEFKGDPQLSLIPSLYNKLKQEGYDFTITSDSPKKTLKSMGSPWQCGVLTVSDRCSRGEAEDTSGKNLQDLLNGGTLLQAQVVRKSCVPDELAEIKKTLLQWCDDGIQLILTTGGTGFAPRDITPEAVSQVIEREAPGLSTVMITESLKVTPLAALSRPLCGIRGNTLIITLPGSKKASEECIRFLSGCLSHALQVLMQQNTQVDATHKHLQSQGVQHQHHHHHNHQHKSQHKHQHNQHHCHHHHSHDHSSKADVSRVSRRARKSPYPMISVEEAQKMVLANAYRCSTKMVPMSKALGSVIAQDVYAKDALPPFPASIKDGYAVLASDGAGLRAVSGDSTAGAGPDERRVTAGVCVRVNTGAPVPPGADAVVQVEDTELTIEEDDGRIEREIKILSAPKAGQDIRPTGCDIMPGECVLPTDTRLGPAELGLLAAVGVVQVLVYEDPSITVLSTGNELQEPGEDLQEGHIRDSNKTTLMALIKQNGFHAVDGGIARDEPSVLLASLHSALSHSDILVTTGGVSMGERDILRPVLQADFNATIHFAQVFMKPGKPTTFATCNYEGRNKLILGLPGNPVSATVTAHLYLLPAARKMAGRTDYMNTTIRAKLGSKFRLDPRPEYHRCTLQWSADEDLPTAQSTGNQLSSRLLSCAAAQALLKLPPAQEDKTSLPQGHVVEAILL